MVWDGVGEETFHCQNYTFGYKVFFKDLLTDFKRNHIAYFSVLNAFDRETYTTILLHGSKQANGTSQRI